MILLLMTTDDFDKTVYDQDLVKFLYNILHVICYIIYIYTPISWS